ncbi:BnaC03g64170D [Brassica napus]|uniref:BnaC03g64170D protein n=1 Tax=Brassica napus TaxID=3708 RepID=A0A078I859_BRANA|nr:BnaC03g64170D [Brassica napus]
MSETHTSQLSQKQKAAESTKRLLSSKIKPNEGGIRAWGLGKPKQRLMLMKIGDLQLDLVRMLLKIQV